MHVFVDESGDLGFSKASTKYFVVAYIECNSPIKIRTDLKRLLKNLHQKRIYSMSRNELKFSRMDDYCRKRVLQKIAEYDFSLGVIVMEKA